MTRPEGQPLEPGRLGSELAQLRRDDFTSRQAPWALLKDRPDEVIAVLAAEYARATRAPERAEVLAHAMWWARESPAAAALAAAALADRARIVRFTACQLLALAQLPEHVRDLAPLLAHPDAATVEDARSATFALLAGEYDLFYDRRWRGHVHAYVVLPDRSTIPRDRTFDQPEQHDETVVEFRDRVSDAVNDGLAVVAATDPTLAASLVDGLSAGWTLPEP